ncbi:MAG: hypothetical protein C4290_05880, partial [Chloroflexota bacterium]
MIAMSPTKGSADGPLPDESVRRRRSTSAASFPEGAHGLLALCFLGTVRAALTAGLLSLVCIALWVTSLTLA